VAGLGLAYLAGMAEDERGGTAAVLLHGWDEPGDELIPLARTLTRPGTRVFVPAAPLTEPGGGRAWWHLDPGDRPAWAWDDTEPEGYEPHRLVTAARTAVQGLLDTARARYAPDTMVMAGFSQGAMLALDVGPRVFLAHGHDVVWRPFDGDHAIPPGIVSALGDFLFDA
jgi:predicted esterase